MVGGPLTLTVQTDAAQATVQWSGPLAAAHTHPFAEPALRTAFARLGDTPFTLGTVTLAVPDAVLVPKSVLNELRRQAVAAVLAQRHPTAHPLAVPQALAELRRALPPALPPAPAPQLSVLVRTLEQLTAVLACQQAARVYADFEDSRRYREAVRLARAAGVPIGLAPLRIMKPGEEGFLKALLAAEPDAVLVRNLGSIDYCREHAPQVPLVADFALNVANELTAHALHALRVERLVPSFDLNWEQLAALVRRCPADWFEPVVHQHMPMFHMEHCVFAAFLSTGKDWRDCGRPCDRHRVEVQDRVGAKFPVLADAGCRNTVFNAVPQSAAEFLPRMLALGLRHFRVDLLRETPAEVGPLLERYARVLAGRDDGRDTWRHLRGLNQLGVTRGTLQLV
jgi:putative protease